MFEYIVLVFIMIGNSVTSHLTALIHDKVQTELLEYYLLAGLLHEQIIIQ